MTRSTAAPPVLRTTAGDLPLAECRLSVGGRVWSVLHVAAVFSRAEEDRFLTDRADAIPYGVALWPSAVALAHDIATRPAEFQNKTVLELGAGTGLPGIVAASLGASVVQTDRHELALHICRLNGERNGTADAEYRLVEWAEWGDDRRYDWILAADVLYADSNHPHLRKIFEAGLAPGGRILLADPYRRTGLLLLESLEADGWRITHTRWGIGEGADARPIAVYELSPPETEAQAER